RTAQTLWEKGYAFDYVSDRQLALAKVVDGQIQMPGGRYRTILVPPCRYMPLGTLLRLLILAGNGARILFQDGLPEDVPGLGNLEKRRETLRMTLAGFRWSAADRQGVRHASFGKGRLLIGADLSVLLERAGARREPVCDHPGLMCLRRRKRAAHPGGRQRS